MFVFNPVKGVITCAARVAGSFSLSTEDTVLPLLPRSLSLSLSGGKAASQSGGSISKRQLWTGTSSHPGVQNTLEGMSIKIKQFNWRLEEGVTESKRGGVRLARVLPEPVFPLNNSHLLLTIWNVCLCIQFMSANIMIGIYYSLHNFRCLHSNIHWAAADYYYYTSWKDCILN